MFTLNWDTNKEARYDRIFDSTSIGFDAGADA